MDMETESIIYIVSELHVMQTKVIFIVVGNMLVEVPVLTLLISISIGSDFRWCSYIEERCAYSYQ